MTDIAHPPHVEEPARAVQPAAQAPLVRVRELTMAFGDNVVQRDLTFDVLPGEVLAIAGGSGCGKSTLMRHLIGLQVPAAGQVFYGDRDLYAADDASRRTLMQAFGVTFQAGALWSSMTVGENVMLPMQVFTDMSAAECEQEARFKLALVGLAGSFDVEPATLSGGMKKRAAIARALALNPPLLFLDEPSAGLDPLTSANLDELIQHLRDDLGTTVVMVSHELDSIFALADRLLFLDAQTRTMTALAQADALQLCRLMAGLVVAEPIGAQCPQQLAGVVLIKQREALFQPQFAVLFFQQVEAEGVESADGQTARFCLAQHLGNALFHFACRLVGKGNGGDMACWQAALLHQMGDFGGDDAGFAATGAGQHQARAADIINRFTLLWV